MEKREGSTPDDASLISTGVILSAGSSPQASERSRRTLMPAKLLGQQATMTIGHRELRHTSPPQGELKPLQPGVETPGPSKVNLA